MATYAPLPTYNFDVMNEKHDSVHDNMHKSQKPFLDSPQDTVLLYAKGIDDITQVPIAPEDLSSPISPDTVSQISQHSQLPSHFGPEDIIAEIRQESKSAGYTCCRCEHNQKLDLTLPAACENCTKAMCRKCLIQSEEVVPIGKNSRAQMPVNGVPGQAWWFCHNCGVKRDVPTSKVRLQKDGSVTVDLGKLVCEPCNQKACGLCLAVVEIETADTEDEGFEGQLDPPNAPLRNHHSSVHLRSQMSTPPLRTHHSSMHLRNKASIDTQSGPSIEVPKRRIQHIPKQPSLQGDAFFHATSTSQDKSRQPQTKDEGVPLRSQSSRINMTRLWSMKMVRRFTSR